MPTGYTAGIIEGQSFNEFVLTCARGMGALIMMRDEPMDAPIPDRFKPETSYYKANIKRDKKELKYLLNLSDEGKQLKCNEYNEEQLNKWEARKINNEEQKNKYLAMLNQVNAWQPPSKDHVGFKEFMVSQISQSIDFDCSMKYDTKPEPVSVDDWFATSVNYLEKSIAYYEKSMSEEIERTNKRSDWMQDLKKSLNLQTA